MHCKVGLCSVVQHAIESHDRLLLVGRDEVVLGNV